MNDINHKTRDEWYENTSFFFTPLINQKLTKYQCKPNGKGHHEDSIKYLITLHWEKTIIKFNCLDISTILKDFDSCINLKLSDWDAIPNHSCENITFVFNNCTREINFNVYGDVYWCRS